MLLAGVTSVGAAGVSYVVWDIKRHQVYPEQSFKEAARHYTAVRSLTVIGTIMRYRLVRATKNVEKAQTDFLLQQIKENMDTQYSKDMGVRLIYIYYVAIIAKCFTELEAEYFSQLITFLKDSLSFIEVQ